MPAYLSDEALDALVRSIPDYPRAGINFKDITTLLRDAAGFQNIVARLAQPFQNTDIDGVAGIEARGFILGGAVAFTLGTGFIPVRKKGKLPHTTLRQDYALEYGVDTLEMHTDALSKGQKILLVDDLIATGGSAEAAITLIRRLGGECVGAAFAIELTALGGMQRLQHMNVPGHAVLQYA